MRDTATGKMAVEAVMQLLHRDDDGEPLYLWRRCDAAGHWLEAPADGGLEDLRERLPADTPVCLLVPGTEVVIQRMGFAPEERRHLRKLMPFELEDQVTDDLDELHFALGQPGDTQVVTAYVNNAWLASQLEELEAAGLDVIHCYPEPLLLPRPQDTWTLRLDDQLHVHYGPGLGFSVEPSLAALTLSALHEAEPLPAEVLLMGGDRERIETLHDYLPASLREELAEEQIISQEVNRWDSLDIQHPAALELRQGPYARQLPFRRWWQEWRGVAILGAVALFAYVGVNLAQIQMLNAQHREVLAQTEDVFREVVPQGQMADAESQLRNKLSAFEGQGGGGSIIDMYAKVAPLVAENDAIELRTLRYTDQTGDMQLTVEADTYSSVVSLNDAINASGLEARLQNTSQRGDTQQARMIISRAAL